MVLILLAVAGVFTVKAASRTKPAPLLPNGTSDPDIVSAHNYLRIASIIAWVTVGVTVILLAVGIYYGGKIIFGKGSAIFIVFIIIIIILTLVTGIYAILGTEKIHSSSLRVGNATLQAAYKYGIIASIVTILGIALIIGGFAAFIIAQGEEKKKIVTHEKKEVQSQASVKSLGYNAVIQDAKVKILQQQLLEGELQQQIDNQKTIAANGGVDPNNVNSVVSNVPITPGEAASISPSSTNVSTPSSFQQAAQGLTQEQLASLYSGVANRVTTTTISS